MIIARVVGSVVATQKTASLTGRKLLTVEPLQLGPEDAEELTSTHRLLVAVDAVGAGVGETVLVVHGSSARLTPETENLPVDAVIVGIVDAVHVGGQAVYRSQG